MTFYLIKTYYYMFRVHMLSEVIVMNVKEEMINLKKQNKTYKEISLS